MRRVLGWTLAVLVACNRNDKDAVGDDDDDDDDDTSYTFDCAVSEPYDLPDPFAPIEGNEHACEDAQYYNPALAVASAYFVGEFHYDDCGNVRGQETWLLYANPRWVELGGHDCQVVWRLDGTATPGAGDDLILDIAAVVDSAATTCGDIVNGAGENFMDFVDASYNESYQLSRVGGDATFFFTGGAEFGRGKANANHSNYASSLQCPTF
jgi:hypothetical protein